MPIVLTPPDAQATVTGATAGGGLLQATSAAHKRIYHAGRAFTYADVAVTVAHRMDTTVPASDYRVGALARRLSPGDYLTAHVSNGALFLRKSDSGTLSDLVASTAITALTAGAEYWLRLLCDGDTLRAEHWTTEPTPMGTPANALTHTLTGADATKFGAGIEGQAGIYWTPATNWPNARITSFRAEPYTYRGRTLPARIALGGKVPGDIPALCDLQLAHENTGGTLAVNLAPNPRPGPALSIGGYLTSGGAYIDGTNTLIASRTGGPPGLSEPRFTVASSGSTQGGVVLPLTAPTGGWVAGRVYKARAWVRSDNGQPVGILVGHLDPAGGVAEVLVAAPNWRPIDVTFTATNTTGVVVSVRSPSAAAFFTFSLIQASVVASTSAPLPAYGDGASLGGVWLGIPYASASTSPNPPAPVYALAGWAPRSSALGPVGPAVSTNRTGFALATDTAAFYAEALTITATGPGAGSAEWTLDLTPYAAGGAETVEIDVYARVGLSPTMSGLALVLSALPDGGTAYGPPRLSDRGTTGLVPTMPATAFAWRVERLGRLTCPTGPVRVSVAAMWDGATTSRLAIDHLFVVLADRHADSPRGMPLNTSYPRLFRTLAATEKTLRHDGSATIAGPTGPPVPDHGLGSRIEIDLGTVDLALWLATAIPGNPVRDDSQAAPSHTVTVHPSLLPRYVYS